MTSALPGTSKKIQILKDRASQGQPLFLPGDAPLPGGTDRGPRVQGAPGDSPERIYTSFLEAMGEYEDLGPRTGWQGLAALEAEGDWCE